MRLDELAARPDTTIRVKIETDTPVGWFSDSLYYQLTEVPALTHLTVDAAKNKRIDNYVALVKEQSSRPPVHLTLAELLEQEKRTFEQVDRVTDAILAAKPTREELVALAAAAQARLDKIKAAITVSR